MLRSTLLVSLGVAAALTQPAPVPLPTAIIVRPDIVLISPMLGAADGDLVTLTGSGGHVVTQTLALYFLQIPEGLSDSDYRCRVIWSGVEVGATSVDVTAWPEVWPDAAWHLSTASAPTLDDGGCASLDPDRLGSAPIETLAKAGWNVGYGPMTARVSVQCGLASMQDSASVVAIYAWMDGARPFPVGAAMVEAIDASGKLTGERVPNASTATTSPSGMYADLSRCTLGVAL